MIKLQYEIAEIVSMLREHILSTVWSYCASRPEFNSFVKLVTHEQIDLDPSGTAFIDSLRYFISLILPTV